MIDAALLSLALVAAPAGASEPCPSNQETEVLDALSTALHNGLKGDAALQLRQFIEADFRARNPTPGDAVDHSADMLDSQAVVAAIGQFAEAESVCDSGDLGNAALHHLLALGVSDAYLNGDSELLVDFGATIDFACPIWEVQDEQLFDAFTTVYYTSVSRRIGRDYAGAIALMDGVIEALGLQPTSEQQLDWMRCALAQNAQAEALSAELALGRLDDARSRLKQLVQLERNCGSADLQWARESFVQLMNILIVRSDYESCFERIEKEVGTSFSECFDSAPAEIDEFSRIDLLSRLCLCQAYSLRWLVPRDEERWSSKIAATLENLRWVAGLEGIDRVARAEASLSIVELELARGNRDAAAAELDAVSSNNGSESTDLFADPFLQTRRLAARTALMNDEGDDLTSVVEELLSSTEALIEDRRRVPAEVGSVGYFSIGHRRAVLVDALMAANADDRIAESFAILSQAQACGVRERSLNLEAPSLATTQSTLAAVDATLLAYLPGPESTALLIVDDAKVELLRLPSFEQVREFVDTLRSELHRVPASSESGLSASGQAASEALVANLLPERVLDVVRNAGEVMVVGRDFLERVPLDYLLQVALDGSTVGVSYPSSIPLAVHGASSALPDTTHCILLGPPEGVPGASAKKGTTISVPASVVDGWARDLGGDVDFVSGKQATPQSLKAAFESSPLVLQVLCHGALDRSRERPGGLALFSEVTAGEARPSDGVVWYDQISQYSGSPALVVLASCSTATGIERPGEGAAPSLASAFMERGARAVVVAETDIPVDATLVLLTHLYRSLRAGDSIARSLSKAKSEVAADARWSHPFFHANLSIIGNGAATLFDADESR